MCSILGILETTMEAGELRRLALELSRRQRHRWRAGESSPRLFERPSPTPFTGNS